eukprot:2002977-Rhodomonas_salina.1
MRLCVCVRARACERLCLSVRAARARHPPACSTRARRSASTPSRPSSRSRRRRSGRACTAARRTRAAPACVWDPATATRADTPPPSRGPRTGC